MTRIRLSAVASAVAAALALNIAHADATLRERMSVEGQGIMAFANMSGTTTTQVSGKRSRTESDLQMESRMVRMFARGVGGPTAEIVRLDEDKVYQLDLKKRTYTENSLAAQRARMQQAMEQAKQQQEKQPAPTGMDESECEWSDPTVDVNKTGAKGTFAGYSADQVVVVAKQSCKSRKDGSICDVALSLEEWVAPGFEGSDELTKFGYAYAQQMGGAELSKQATDRAQALFGRYKGAWEKVAAKMKDIKGYPVKTSFAFGMGGAQCKTTNATQTADSGGGSAAPTSMAGALAGQIAGSLFGRRKKESTETAAPATPPPPGMANMITPIRITSELVSFSKDSLPAGTFEVPGDFKKTGSAE